MRQQKEIITAKFRISSLHMLTVQQVQLCSAHGMRFEQEVLLSGIRARAGSSLNLQVISQGNVKLQNSVGGQWT